MSNELNPGYLELQHLPEKGYNTPDSAIRNVIGESEDWSTGCTNDLGRINNIYLIPCGSLPKEKPVETVDVETEVIENEQVSKVVIEDPNTGCIFPLSIVGNKELEEKLLNGTWKEDFYCHDARHGSVVCERQCIPCKEGDVNLEETDSMPLSRTTGVYERQVLNGIIYPGKELGQPREDKPATEA